MQKNLSKMQKEIIKMTYQNDKRKIYRNELTYKLAEKLGKDPRSNSFQVTLCNSLKSLIKRDLISVNKFRYINYIEITEEGIKTAMELSGKPIKTDESGVVWDI